MIVIERLHPEALLPTRTTKDRVGLDLYALLLNERGGANTAMIPPRSSRLIPTGIKAQTERGFFMIHSHKSLAERSIFTTTRVIDPDYRGEIKVLLYNGSQEPYYVRHRDRIAQLVVHECLPSEFVEGTVDGTDRGESGFGSSGR